MKKLVLLILICIAVAANSQPNFYKERYRPQFHFSTQRNWINDPNGLIYHNGEYHLFYQHNPFGNNWGHMSWGHAVSKDLLKWKELPVAIKESNDKMIFSGSMVADLKNRSGLGKNKEDVPLVAIYTAHDSALQNQYLAYSIDGGKSFSNYTGNPVLDLQMKDFRDPNVFWYEAGKKWIMSVSMPNEKMIAFYSSFSLKQWKYEGDFGPVGDLSGVWECPDLIQVPIVGEPLKKKWVLLVSQNSSMQYFVGNFNGAKFFNENPSNKIFRPDYGMDYYAAVSYKTTPDKIPVTFGWVNNWNYAGDIPTKPWKGTMSLPRKLAVKKMGNEWILIQEPIKAINSLRSTAEVLKEPVSVKTNFTTPFKGQCFEMELDIRPTATSVSGVKIAVGGNRYFSIKYVANVEQLYIERTGPLVPFSTQFPFFNQKNAYLKTKNDVVHLHIYFDKSIVEVYANNGELVFTAQVFPEESDTGIEFFSDGNATVFENVWFWPMKSIWK